MTRPHALVDFTEAAPGGGPLRCAFGPPARVLVARRLDEVPAVLQAAEAEARAGRWCVGFLRYEAAAAFDAAAQVHPAEGPLAWFGVHDAPMGDEPSDEDAGTYAPLDWHCSETPARFQASVARIHAAITAGEVYQVNHTARLTAAFDGDPLALFHALRRAQPGAYAAFIDTGDEQVLSVSPELFFDWRDGRLLSRPMKGTAPRGATPQEDAARAEELLASDKERAENLMIVDLIRNDLSRVAQPHSVQVPRLFERRAWPTVWQMTSDVTARTRPGTRLVDVFRALFPCGSVTGAPKWRAMHWIRQLEDGPRDVYCGAVGVLQPGGTATFNVPIRTVVLRDGRAVCGIGSGITLDAQASSEWQEWQHKRAFLDRARAPFDLLQTLRLEDGRLPHAVWHLDRLAAAARQFAMVFDRAAASAVLDEVARRHAVGLWRVRLLCDPRGHCRAQAFAMAPTPVPVTFRLAERPIESPAEFLRHKTTRREAYEAFAPADASVFDTLLFNPAGEITEFTRGNVIAELADGRRVTPPLSCGLLDGVGRALALQAGVQEAVLRVQDLAHVRRWWFVNALRGELPAQWVGPLATPVGARESAPPLQRTWDSLDQSSEAVRLGKA